VRLIDLVKRWGRGKKKKQEKKGKGKISGLYLFAASLL